MSTRRKEQLLGQLRSADADARAEAADQVREHVIPSIRKTVVDQLVRHLDSRYYDMRTDTQRMLDELLWAIKGVDGYDSQECGARFRGNLSFSMPRKDSVSLTLSALTRTYTFTQAISVTRPWGKICEKGKESSLESNMGIKDRRPSMHLLSGRGEQLDPEPEIQSSQAVLAPIAVGMASRWCLIFGKYEAFSRTPLPVNGYLRTAHNRPQT
jgi:hypothetical protein